MTTFADVIVKPGVGVALGCDVSVDGFSTVSYRYGTVAGKLDGTNEYDARIINVGKLQRGLGDNRNVTASTTSLTFRNEDFALDWMANRSTFEAAVLKAQWRLFIVAWEPATPSTRYAKTLGIFSTLDNPIRRAADIYVSLADMVLGDAFELRVTPRISDINNQINTALSTGSWFWIQDEEVIPGDEHCPVVFGRFCEPKLMRKPSAASRSGSLAFLLYATLDTDTTVYDWTAYRFSLLGAVISRKYWDVKRATHTVDGRTWQVYYIDLDCLAFCVELVGVSESGFAAYARALGYAPPEAIWVNTAPGTYGQSSLPPPIGVDYDTDGHPTKDYDPLITAQIYKYPAFMVSEMFEWAAKQRDGSCTARLYPASSINYETPTGIPDAVTADVWYPDFENTVGALLPRVHFTDVIWDLLKTYSRGSDHIDLDEPSFAEVKAAKPGAEVSGSIGSSEIAKQEASAIVSVGGTLRKTLTSICSFTNTDLYTNWDGQFALSAETFSFTNLTATFTSLDEVLLSEMSETIPNPGERNGYVNRTFFDTGIRVIGPVDDTVSIAAVERIFPRTVDASWAPIGNKYVDLEGFVSVFPFAAFAMKVRPTLRFLYPLEGLNVEIGDYVTMSWTRGGGGGAVFTDSIFRVEGVCLDALSAQTEITLSWADDFKSDLPYLLDDEDYTLIASGGGTRNATVTDGSAIVTVALDGSGDGLQTNGVNPGDVFVMKDPLGTGFARFRAVIIDDVTDETTMQLVAGTDLDFGTAGAHTFSEWEIWYGDVNYPSVGHPIVGSQYPDGNTPYGRSSTTDGNRYHGVDPSWKLKAG